MDTYQRAYRVASVMEARNSFYFRPFYISYVLRGMDDEYKREWPQVSYDLALQLIAEARTQMRKKP